MAELYPDAPWDLLARHLAAEATPAEQARLRHWLHADPVHLQILTTVTRAWERAGEAAPAPMRFTVHDVEAAWQRFRPLMGAEPAAPEAVVRHFGSSAWVGPLLRMAAAAAVIVAGGAYAFFVVRPGSAQLVAATYTSSAQRRFLRLPDGSAVWLNAHSRLRYAGAAATGQRAVQLLGEAYFEVKPAASRPFWVSSATARVRVTGTAFNVRAYAAEDSVEVCVTHGRVWLASLAGVSDSVLLTAGTRAALYASDAPGRATTPLRRTAAPNDNFRAWQTDTLRFQDQPVAQVLRTLRAAFGTRVALGSAGLANCRFTGTFAHPQPAQVLAVLAVATGSRADTTAGGFVLRGPGCPDFAGGASRP